MFKGLHPIIFKIICSFLSVFGLLLFIPQSAFADSTSFNISNINYNFSAGTLSFDTDIAINATTNGYGYYMTAIFPSSGVPGDGSNWFNLWQVTCSGTHCSGTFAVGSDIPSAVSNVTFCIGAPGFGLCSNKSDTYQSQSVSNPFPKPTYSITGSVYNDDNQNGAQDTGELGYNGATVTLNTGQTATTDSNGNYTFSNLPAGTYTETLTVPNGYSATTTNPATETISANTTQNFGIYSAPVVSAITAPASPAQVNTSVSTSATFTDGDTTDTHTALWEWGDTSSSSVAVTE